MYSRFIAAGIFFGAAWLMQAQPASSGSERTLFLFPAGTNADFSIGDILWTDKGAFGATTSLSSAGGGTIYFLAPSGSAGAPWVMTTLYTFAPNSGTPAGGLLATGDGSLLGTAGAGTGDYGSVYELRPPAVSGQAWTFKTVYAFGAGDGPRTPNGGLIADQSGHLYGVSTAGGTYGGGTVYELIAPSEAGGPWTVAVLYSFKERLDGSAPGAYLTMDANGALFGTAGDAGYEGGGTVFRLTPPVGAVGQWEHETLWDFTGDAVMGQANGPTGHLVVGSDGSVYGTTVTGGVGVGFGTVFRLTPTGPGNAPWKEEILYSFNPSIGDGQSPFGGLAIGKGDVLYGTTEYGTGGTCGTVFSLAPNGSSGWSETVLYQFRLVEGLCTPQSRLEVAGDGTLYGNTSGMYIPHTSTWVGSGIFELR